MSIAAVFNRADVVIASEKINKQRKCIEKYWPLRPSSAPYRRAHGFDFIHTCISFQDFFCNHVIIYVFKCMKLLTVKRSW